MYNSMSQLKRQLCLLPLKDRDIQANFTNALDSKSLTSDARKLWVPAKVTRGDSRVTKFSDWPQYDLIFSSLQFYRKPGT